jgi:hypothetical protein
MSNKYWGWGLEDDEFFVRYRYAINFLKKICLYYQCCGSGLRCLLDPGMGKKSRSGPRDPGSRMSIPIHEYLNSLMRIRILDPGSGIFLILDPG